MFSNGFGARAVFVVSVVWLAAGAANARVSFETLVRELTDLERLTRFPNPEYSTRQFSSYDQRSKNPNVPTDEDWFANGDRGQHLRVEERNGQQEWVLMDAEGPGAIVRFWSANPGDAGVVRIYLDNRKDPIVEMPLTDLLGGAAMPFVAPISGERSRGWNSYLPIPYAKHCKVTTSKRDFYYQINYRTYSKGAKVQTYKGRLTKKQEELVQAAANDLAKPGESAPLELWPQQPYELNLGPGRSGGMTIELEMPSALRRFTAKVEAEDLEKALRGCVLSMTFDGHGAPEVIVPLGDFFGTAPGPNSYQSLPSGVDEDGTMYAHWVMPFQKSAVIQFTNTTDSAIAISGEVRADHYKWDDRSMYFHAGWRVENPIPTRPRQDWTFLDARGRGVFVGDMLHVTNHVKDWWGEGDEKIYVDGEAFPSHFGTGSEDYFGYAWCCPEVFTHAYHNQPRCDGPGNYGQTCVSRFHVIDNIPFTQSFKFDMEVWHWAETDVAMAATSYWYAFPGGDNAYRPFAPDDLTIVAARPLPPPRRVEGALEGEDLKVLEKSGGIAERQDSIVDKWSSGAHLWWRDARPGDVLALAIPVESAGTYELRAAFTKAIDYGIVDITLNGKPAASALDLFNRGVIVTEEQSLGTFELTKDENILRVVIAGTNPEADPRHMFGLDYVRLVAVK